MTRPRVYLDWNASAPLRPEARAAMLQAMDLVGNPASVHAEGRAARAIVERARAQLADLVGCGPDEIVFTSGATEAAAMLMHAATLRHSSPVDHDCLVEWAEDADGPTFDVDGDLFWACALPKPGEVSGMTYADGETGIIVDDYVWRAGEVGSGRSKRHGKRSDGSFGLLFYDITQMVGRVERPWEWIRRSDDFDAAILSCHKFGGPTGVGAAIIASGVEPAPLLRGGGQESRRRAGTENVIGIAGMGAAAEAAARDIEAGVWEQVERLRNILEERLSEAAPDLICFGKKSNRLPNTSCFAIPGWKGETQVMQMDLAGFAVSAGSACSSGKVGPSRVLKAMGFDDVTAQSALRVSLGPTTTAAEVHAFADAWIDRYRRFSAKRPAEDRVPQGA
ncbi:MAG: aminotransferase class V-fold PLP-dependent enzyme [Pseudomonadota bacterium]